MADFSKPNTDRTTEGPPVDSSTLLGWVFDGAAYVGIHKNAAGRVTLVVNNGDGSTRTSCSKKGLSYAERLMVCCSRLWDEKPNSAISGKFPHITRTTENGESK